MVVVAALVPARKGAWIGLKAVRGLGSLKDSKKLAPGRREAWISYFKRKGNGSGEVHFAAARVYPRGIEKLNISGAANRAAARALAALVKKYGIDPVKTPIFLDGGLFLGSRGLQARSFPNAKTIVRGDEKIPAVAAASIVAKVARDRFMTKLSRRYPSYSFEVNKGYGTAAHRAALKKRARVRRID